MSIILKFKKFQEETKRNLSKILEEYFSKESEIFNDITDMTREWEDDGVEFSYRLTLCPNDDDYSDEYEEESDNFFDSGSISEIDISSLFSSSSISTTSDLIELIEDKGKILTLYISLSGSFSDENLLKKCLDSLCSRIKSAYPDISAKSSSKYSSHYLEIVMD